MSWIEYDKDGMIGEKGGEEACLALRDCLEYRKAQGDTWLTMQKLFSSLLLAASQTSQEYTLDEGQQRARELVVLFEDGAKKHFSLPEEKQADEYMVSRLAEMISNTAEMYRLFLHRKPHLNEILACFHFILDIDWYRYRFMPVEDKIVCLGVEPV